MFGRWQMSRMKSVGGMRMRIDFQSGAGGRLRSAANVGTMSRMNPYEPPHTADERIPAQRRRKLIVTLSLAVAAGMIILVVRVQATRAVQAESMRARQAAEVAELRARDAALKAESEQNSAAP
jgi:hypothetical protein